MIQQASGVFCRQQQIETEINGINKRSSGIRANEK